MSVKRRVVLFVPSLEQRPQLTRRRSPRQQRSQGLVADVLEAAERLLLSEGVAAVTPQRIAKLAGVSVGSLYQYFPTSLAVLRALLERHLGAIGNSIQIAAAEVSSADELLSRMLQVFLEEKSRRGPLSIALRRIEPLIEGRVVEQQTTKQLAVLFTSRLNDLRGSELRLDAWQVELMMAAVSGAVGYALETTTAEQLRGPDFRATLLRMANSILSRT